MSRVYSSPTSVRRPAAEISNGDTPECYKKLSVQDRRAATLLCGDEERFEGTRGNSITFLPRLKRLTPRCIECGFKVGAKLSAELDTEGS